MFIVDKLYANANPNKENKDNASINDVEINQWIDWY